MRNYIRRFKLSNGKWAYIQDPRLIPFAKQNVRRLHAVWTPPPYFYHVRSGGHVAALRAHLPSISFGKIDLSNFFYSVHRNRITRCLKALGLQFADADAFAVASTVHVSSPHHRFALPFGFLQSPILASIALDHSALGNALRSLHEDGLIVSVYVDDILISSSTEKRVNEALNVLQEAATLSSFPINKTKTHGPTDAIAAFNIVLGSNEMRITKERMESLSQAVLMHGPGPASNGILGYVASVNEMQANNLLSALPRSFPHLNT